MVPIQMEQGLRGGMLLGWALKGDSIWGIAKGLTSGLDILMALLCFPPNLRFLEKFLAGILGSLIPQS